MVRVIENGLFKSYNCFMSNCSTNTNDSVSQLQIMNLVRYYRDTLLIFVKVSFYAFYYLTIFIYEKYAERFTQRFFIEISQTKEIAAFIVKIMCISDMRILFLNK